MPFENPQRLTRRRSSAGPVPPRRPLGNGLDGNNPHRQGPRPTFLTLRDHGKVYVADLPNLSDGQLAHVFKEAEEVLISLQRRINDLETDTVYDVLETIDYTADMTLGNVESPEILNTVTSDGDDGGVSDPTDGCELPENTIFLTTSGEVLYNIPDAIGGFQFDVVGATVTGASGGDAVANGFSVSTSATTVLGFSFTGSVIPAGSGVLTILEVVGSDACLSLIHI